MSSTFNHENEIGFLHLRYISPFGNTAFLSFIGHSDGLRGLLDTIMIIKLIKTIYQYHYQLRQKSYSITRIQNYYAIEKLGNSALNGSTPFDWSQQVRIARSSEDKGHLDKFRATVYSFL